MNDYCYLTVYVYMYCFCLGGGCHVSCGTDGTAALQRYARGLPLDQ